MALSSRFLYRLPAISFSLCRSSPALLSLRKCQSQSRMFTLRSQNVRFLHISSGENDLGRRMKIQARSKEEAPVAEDGNGGEEPPENGALFERPLDERIVAVELHKEATDSYLSYAMSVLLGRALPDVRDGLKPVHRRILFAMHELGLSSRRPYKKCARVVGEVLGKFHPHGDTAVYDSLVRMAQGFSLRSPLISGHGNFGSVDADPPAAMRYTEARLEALSEAMLLADLELDTVDFVPNFDGSQKEPSLLPARLPHVLLNGAAGIAVGMATNIPPHNLGEVTDALIALIHNPAATVQQLMEYMPGPDFPTGGKIMGDIGILEAYRTGRGSLILRGKTEVEVLNKKTNLSALIITELPYQTNKAALVEKIAQLVDDKELEGISSIRDESDRTGMRVVLELKRGSEPSIVLNNLYKSTSLQSSFSCNMVGILDGRPKLMGLKDMLQAFLDFRCSVVERRARFQLKVAEERDHIVKGILIGLGNLDRVISIIRESPNHSETITALKEGYNLSDKQAEAILNITLRRLTSLERTKFIEEHKLLSAEITNLIELLGNRNRILQVIEKEALELKDKFGTPRRSVLEEGVSGELEDIDVIPNEEVLLALSKKGYVKRMKPDTFNLQHRGTAGKSLGKLRQDDSMSEFVICRAHDHILYFSDKGTVYAARAFRVPEGSRTATGVPLIRDFPKAEMEEALLPKRASCITVHTGGWKASLFIIGVEVAERMSYYSISSSLITYLTNDLHQSTATAAKNVNIWSGVSAILPFLGAFLADVYWGRYWTTLLSSIIYLLGLVFLTTSVSVPYLKPPPCDTTESSCSKATPLQIGVFFGSLYLIALGTGGHKPCIEAFGADQFDGDGEENKHRSSFFNWWYFGQCSGALIALSIVLYIEENIGWGVGFAIPTVAMALALFVFLYGSVFYQHKLPSDNLLACVRKTVSKCFVRPRMNVLHLDHLKFPDKAVVEDKQAEKSTGSSVAMQIEEFKLIQNLFPIWATCLMYGIVFAQSATFFTKQGSTMDRKIVGHFQIPPASLQCLIAISILVLVPVYDWMLVPLARKFTKHERGITLLQRIGFGIFISMVAMVVAALIEIKRLKEVKDNGLEDMPDAIVPMNIFWLLPQYVLYGISEVFTMVGMQEYFYDQMPQAMRSLGIAVFLSVLGIGSFLSSIIISIVDYLSSRSSEGSWFSDNLNKAHLDYYYWLLAALCAINLCVYIFCAKRYNNVKVESNVLADEDMPA